MPSLCQKMSTIVTCKPFSFFFNQKPLFTTHSSATFLLDFGFSRKVSYDSRTFHLFCPIASRLAINSKEILRLIKKHCLLTFGKTDEQDSSDKNLEGGTDCTNAVIPFGSERVIQQLGPNVLCGWQKLKKPSHWLKLLFFYDGVVSGQRPILGNTTAVLPVEERFQLITSAGAHPVVKPTVQNKLAGESDSRPP